MITKGDAKEWLERELKSTNALIEALQEANKDIDEQTHVGTLADFQGPEWLLVTIDHEIISTLEMIGVTEEHPDFDDLNNCLLTKADEVSEGCIETVLSIQSNKPWALIAPVYQIKGERIMSGYVSIIASGNFGSRRAIYKIVEDVLVIRDEGENDNLVRNALACDFEGLTIEQAEEKINALNSEGSGHDYDGCHACTWSIRLRLLDEIEVPTHLTYNEPGEAFAIREALRIYKERNEEL